MKTYEAMTLTEENIRQNLTAAGCDSATVQAFLEAYTGGKTVCGTRLLEQHRCKLLQALHAEQKKIDCLDYLLYALKKQGEKA